MSLSLEFLDDPPVMVKPPGNPSGPTDSLSSCPAGPEQWDSAIAIGLMHSADSLVAALGVSGRTPAVSAAAGQVVEAGFVRDMRLLRERLSEFEGVVRSLARGDGRLAPTRRG